MSITSVNSCFVAVFFFAPILFPSFTLVFNYYSRYFGSVLLKAAEHFHFGKIANSYQLSVRKAELQHAGPYTVKAVNLAGEVTASASLTVNGTIHFVP